MFSSVYIIMYIPDLYCVWMAGRMFVQGGGTVQHISECQNSGDVWPLIVCVCGGVSGEVCPLMSTFSLPLPSYWRGSTDTHVV